MAETREDVTPGIHEITLDSFRDFAPLIATEFNNTRRYVWRGQRCDNWPLEPSFSRRTKGKKTDRAKLAELQLKRFRRAVRGKRGVNPQNLSDDELWALGQHFGLATPLLDWTVSPFVALYFAFAETTTQEDSGYRCVFALNKPRVRELSKEVVKGFPDLAYDTVRFFEPEADENARVLSQRGLFSIGPITCAIDEWIEEHCDEHSEDLLVRILLPEEDRADCLRMLNRMNINHLTLYPDLMGAAHFTNIHLDVLNY